MILFSRPLTLRLPLSLFVLLLSFLSISLSTTDFFTVPLISAQWNEFKPSLYRLAPPSSSVSTSFPCFHDFPSSSVFYNLTLLSRPGAYPPYFYSSSPSSPFFYLLNICSLVSEAGCSGNNGVVCKYKRDGALYVATLARVKEGTPPVLPTAEDGIKGSASSSSSSSSASPSAPPPSVVRDSPALLPPPPPPPSLPPPEWSLLDPSQPDAGVQLTYQNGDDAGVPTTVRYEFICREEQEVEGEKEGEENKSNKKDEIEISVEEKSRYEYSIKVVSELACPTTELASLDSSSSSSRSSFVTVFWWCLLILIVVTGCYIPVALYYEWHGLSEYILRWKANRDARRRAADGVDGGAQYESGEIGAGGSYTGYRTMAQGE